jgi:hypothetical protein
MGANANVLAFEILGLPDIRVPPDQKAAVMEAPYQGDRQRRIRRATGARD